MTRAIVFAYHNVGVRCLSVLLAHGVDVALVVTHCDDPAETRWFANVADLAADHEIPTARPDDPNAPAFISRVAALSPDFIFSFYYRKMLSEALLSTARHGAYNMHGSLLPKYRGRAPVNWAVLMGERETGATLHRMVAKPDAGDIVASQAVPILPDDTAFDVFNKVTVASEIALDSILPALIAGSAACHAQDLAQGSYFGARRPEDGRIDWTADAVRIHNLVRAVAPPYPGAFYACAGHRVRVLKTHLLPAGRCAAAHPRGRLFIEDDRLCFRDPDGRDLQLVTTEIDGSIAAVADHLAILRADHDYTDK